MLGPSDLNAMRVTLAESLPDSAQVQRRTLSPDGAGGFTASWVTVATVVCRVAPSGQSPQERAVAERLTLVSIWTLTLPAFTDVRVTDRLVVGARTFEVVAALARSFEMARRVVCAEIV